MARIGATVGRRGVNSPDDVRTIQGLLQRHHIWIRPMRPPAVTGNCDDATIRAIVEFQGRGAALLTPDGVISPSGFTFRQLDRPFIQPPQHRIFNRNNWRHSTATLTSADFGAAATELACEPAAIEAVARTETKRSPWDDENRPTILFERHYFSRLSNRQFDGSHSDISNPRQGGYGLFRVQYQKLWRAAVLNENAALQSASWGAFQIMGANYVAAGHTSVGAFVDAMMESERRHLDAFVDFIKANRPILTALRNRNWTEFARRYNGPGYAENQYDTKMRDEYIRLTTPARVR